MYVVRRGVCRVGISDKAVFQERIKCLLPNTFCAIFAALGIKLFATLVIFTKPPTFCGIGQMQIGLATLTTADSTQDIFS